MAATKLQLNWSAVSFTPNSGTLTTITKVKSVTPDLGGSLIEFAGDNDRFPTVMANDYNAPKVSIESGDIGGLLAFSPGTFGALTATHNDAKAATAGAIVYAFANAMVENITSQGPHRQFGSGTINFRLFSSDGSTNPVSFTRT